MERSGLEREKKLNRFESAVENEVKLKLLERERVGGEMQGELVTKLRLYYIPRLSDTKVNLYIEGGTRKKGGRGVSSKEPRLSPKTKTACRVLERVANEFTLLFFKGGAVRL